MTVDDEKITAAKIKRVDDLAALARTSWFSLLGALAFTAVTLLSLKHRDLLLESRMIDLPIVDVDVQARLFLTLGAIALSVLFLNLHLYLIKLWRAFRNAPPDRPDWRLADNIQPWTVNDFALSLKHDSTPRDRARRHWRNSITLVTVWFATPLLLGWMWWISLVLRDLRVTLPILGCLAFVLLFGSHSWLAANRELATWRPKSGWNAASAAIGVLLAMTSLATWRGFDPSFSVKDRSPLHQMNLDRQDIADVRGALPAAALHREDYRLAWCKIEGVPLDVCGKNQGLKDLAMNGLIVVRQRHCREKGKAAGLRSYGKCNAYFAELDRRFETGWIDVRREALKKVARVDLEGFQIAGLSALDADLTRAMLEKADLSWSNLPRATLEGAALKEADLTHAAAYGANFALADLTDARLAYANFEDAILAGAHLYGANLRHANLEGADLTAADLRGADLTEANIRDARLSQADLRGAILSGADFTGATGLAQAQLNAAVGDDTTEFSFPNTIDDDGNFPMRPFYVGSCWTELPGSLAALVDAYSDLEQRYAERVCPEGVEPEQVGKNTGKARHRFESQLDPDKRERGRRPGDPRLATLAKSTEGFEQSGGQQ